MSTPALSVLIPAAGASIRLGQPKQLVDYRGKPLLGHVIDLAASISPLEIIVVTGANANRVTKSIQKTTVRWLHNPHWREGLGGSVALGATAVNPGSSGLMILLCDQYRIQKNDLIALLDSWCATPERIVASEANGRCMPPLIFPSNMFNSLAKLEGEKGARDLLARHPERVMAIPLPNAAFDLDRPEQLQNL